ncbi:MAG: hypothetical protein OEZ54_09750, partial [Gemmatimonadota bacterium]|nr:hypothetical protein [Gemmatimonadota bacterium]
MDSRKLLRLVAFVLLLASSKSVSAQEQDETTVFDSVAVVGAERVGAATVISRAAIPLGQPVGFLDIQRAIETLYAMGQFDDITVSQGVTDGKQVLLFTVRERGLLMRWDVAGVEKLPERSIRSKVRLVVGRPYDVADATAVAASIDSLYRKEGYYQTDIDLVTETMSDGNVALTFDIDEGERVAISSVVIEGNEAFSAEEIVAEMATKPEGFFWFRKGEFDESVLETDVRENLPSFYASQGYIDFQVTRDTLVIQEGTGKAVLILSVDEGPRYHIGTFEVVGSSEFSPTQLEVYYPFAGERRTGGFLGLVGGEDRGDVFDQSEWLAATENVRTLYFNNGYIYADVRDVISRRTAPDGTPLVDLRWQVAERTPAIVQKIHIVGNSVTHEDVIRQAIYMVPGDVFRQDALIQSYQAISNLGFFEQPMPSPRTEQANQQGDVNIIFEVQERRTGNVNFGASLGQGTGVGGFIGLDEPNMFGKGKRVSFQV